MTMTPDNVPAEIVQAAYDALSAAPQPLLPHVAVPHTIAAAWPAIEAHVRDQVAKDIEQTGLRLRNDVAPYISREALARYQHAARIARGEDR